MFHICSRGGILILIGFVLLVGQCYYIVLQTYNNSQQNLLVAEIPKVVQSINQENIDDELVEQDLSEEPAPIFESQRYQLMERYAQDRLHC